MDGLFRIHENPFAVLLLNGSIIGITYTNVIDSLKLLLLLLSISYTIWKWIIESRKRRK